MCKKCADLKWINTRGKKCGCPNNVEPTFGHPGQKMTKCIKCIEKGMIDLKHIICQCTKKTQAIYGYENGSPICCSKCIKAGMIDLHNKPKPCNNKECGMNASSSCKGYCQPCFINKFPDEPIVKYYRVKELAVVKHIKLTHPDIESKIISNKTIVGGSSKHRPDILLVLPTHAIIIEIDEKQHHKYDNETQRIINIHNDLKEIPLYVIRFNPDEYTSENKEIISPWHQGKIKKKHIVEWESRLTKLNEQFTYCINNIPTIPIKTIYMYFNN
jgi:hypothetical protein